MKLPRSRHVLFCVITVFAALTVAAAAADEGSPPAAQASAPKGLDDYLTAIEALRGGDYPRAADAFGRAMAADDENVDYVRGRGVANVLAERFGAAVKDLRRAEQLQPDDAAETKLWLAAALRMSGDAQAAAQLGGYGGGLPNDYVELVYDDVAMDYFQSRQNGSYFDKAAGRLVKVSRPVTKQFGEAAQRYAARHDVSGEAGASVLAERATASAARGDWAGAVADLAKLRRASPNDEDLRGQWAIGLMRLGGVAQARPELTHALIWRPLWADGYAARAEAAAALGDGRRAATDLRTATALGASTISLDAARKAIDASSAAPPPADDARQRLDRDAEAGAAFDRLVDDAAAVRRWAEARRDRYDEAYQDAVRALAMVLRADPRRAEAMELWARFLLDHRAAPVVWDGPRSGGRQLRPQDRQEQAEEVSHAGDLCDEALKLNPEFAAAMGTKGWVLYVQGSAEEAERWADKGLALAPRDARLIQLKARVEEDRAAAMDQRAAALRAGHTVTRTASNGERVSFYIPPTDEELSQATAAEEQAKALHAQVRRRLDEVDEVATKVVPPLVDRAKAALAAGDLDAAGKALGEAYALGCDEPAVFPALAELFNRRGDALSAEAMTLVARPLRETTAANPLRQAWEAIEQTKWTTAGKLLDQAQAADPADARVPACRSVIAAKRDDADPVAAARQRAVALAQEEARARTMGCSFTGRRGGFASARAASGVELCDVRQAALSMALRLRDAGAANDVARVMAAVTANVDVTNGADRRELVLPAPSAMLPDPDAHAGDAAPAPTVGSLLAWTHLQAGQAMLAQRRPDEAQRQFEQVVEIEANWPSTAEDRQTLTVPVAWARLGLARVAYARGDYDAAFRLLQERPWGLPKELDDQIKQFSQEVGNARRRSR